MSDRFEVTMPGQPPTWNHMYEWTTLTINGRRVRAQSKTAAAMRYQDDLRLVTRAAKPSDFRPIAQVIVAYNMYLKRALDADNVMKACNDALAAALDVNDKDFLPMCLSKNTGNKVPYLHITILDAEVWRPALIREDQQQ